MTRRRYLFFGAHPDDPDLCFGGAAVQLVRAGHAVKFVSMTNGNAGHQSMNASDLAARRRREAQASAAISGIDEYLVLDHDDGGLEPTLAARREVIRLIRRFRPDVVITHRTCDYHADHRATGQLVQDASFLVRVPLCCPDTPVTDANPVFAFSYDPFLQPRRFRADAAVAFDSVLDVKLAMCGCHESQFFEWLPWCDGDRDFDASRMDGAARREHLMRGWMRGYERQADLSREALRAAYGAAGDSVRFAEAFELSEYGRGVSAEEFRRIMLP